MLTKHPEHLKRFDYIGFHRYFLTFCTDHRHPAFGEAAIVNLVLSQFLRAAAEECIAITAYTFMPDHVHLLVEGQSESADGLRFIKRAKQFSGYSYSQQTGQRLWQRYAYERVLRAEEATLSVARYILNNPVRARFVASPEEYPFSGSAKFAISEILTAVQDWRPGARRAR